MSRFDKYTNPALARRRFFEKVLFAFCWVAAALAIGFVLVRAASQSGPTVRYTFTGSPVVDACGMSVVLGFVLAAATVLIVRWVRGLPD